MKAKIFVLTIILAMTLQAMIVRTVLGAAVDPIACNQQRSYDAIINAFIPGLEAALRSYGWTPVITDVRSSGGNMAVFGCPDLWTHTIWVSLAELPSWNPGMDLVVGLIDGSTGPIPSPKALAQAFIFAAKGTLPIPPAENYGTGRGGGDITDSDYYWSTVQRQLATWKPSSSNTGTTNTTSQTSGTSLSNTSNTTTSTQTTLNSLVATLNTLMQKYQAMVVSSGNTSTQTTSSDGTTSSVPSTTTARDDLMQKYQNLLNSVSNSNTSAQSATVTAFPAIITVTAGTLNVRSAPNTSAPLSGSQTLHVGDQFIAAEAVTGDSVEGENMWWKSSLGNYVWSGGTIQNSPAN